MADDVLRTRRGRRENSILLCARSVFSVSAAVRCLSIPVHSNETALVNLLQKSDLVSRFADLLRLIY